MPEPAADIAVSNLVRQHAARHAPPDALAERIRAGLPQASAQAFAQPAAQTPVQAPAQAPSHAPPNAPARTFARWRRALESLALFGAGLATAWVAASILQVATPIGDEVPAEITASHVRSLQADHLADIQATNHHTVKPWFAGRIDFSPPVVDLAEQGFPMTGGRLDYIDGRPVAALVYGHGSHVINLFTWPAAPGQRDQPARFATRQGYRLVHWTAAGMNAWAISDLDPGELQAFAELVRTRMAAPQAQ